MLTFFSARKDVSKLERTPQKKIEIPLTLIITLTPKNAEALRDCQFWIGKSPEDTLNMAFSQYMESIGEGRMWEIARDPKKRAEAFTRNRLSEEEIANLNAKLDATFTDLHAESTRQNARIFMPDKQRPVHA